jgi:hypothetical protein
MCHEKLHQKQHVHGCMHMTLLNQRCCLHLNAIELLQCSLESLCVHARVWRLPGCSQDTQSPSSELGFKISLHFVSCFPAKTVHYGQRLQHTCIPLLTCSVALQAFSVRVKLFDGLYI